MNRFLFWLASFLPCQIISQDDQPYLERYYLFTLLGVRFYLHRFVDSDPARGMHDHPWPWAGSVVLSGYYLEERRGLERHAITQSMARVFGTEGTTRHRIRWFNFMLGDNFHRVVLPRVWTEIKDDAGKTVGQAYGPAPCWTLFFHRAMFSKPWGFLRPMEGHSCLMWVPHNYPQDGAAGASGAWWKTAPKGRTAGRAEL